MATPGDFTCSVLQDVTIAQEEMFTSGNYKELTPKINVLQGLVERQGAIIQDIMQGKTCIGVEITTLRSADTIVDDCEQTGYEVDCTISGTETGSECKTFSPNLCLMAKYSVSEEDCDNFHSWENALAYRQAYAIARLEEAIAAKIAPFLQANATVPQWQGGLGSAGGVNQEWNIPAASWDSSILAEFAYAAEVERLADYTIVSGRNLWNNHFLAMYNGSACCTTDALFSDTALGNPIIFDAFNLDTITSTASTYLVDRSALIFWGKNKYMNDTPLRRGKDNFVYHRVRSPRLQYRNGNTLTPVYYDVIGQDVCTDHANYWGRDFTWNFEVTFHGGLHTNLADFNSSSGILEYQSV